MPLIFDPTATIMEHFAKLKDPRVDRTKKHLLTDILTITLCAVICGADSWTDVEDFGICKERWFRTFLELPNGIPSHDTFGRVIAALDSEIFSICFTQWINAVCEISRESIVAIDGKTLRHSFDRGSQQAAIHMVSAWSENNQMVWGQVKTEEKSNEITAIPKLLEMLALESCIVTIDAMGCQKKIAEAIIGKKADYVLSLKGNQSTMEEEVRLFFDGALKTNLNGIYHDIYETIDKGHGRIETRRYIVSPDIDWFADRKEWKGLKSFGMVESKREIGDTVLSIFRRIALNLLKQEPRKRGINGKRKICGWDENYLLKVIGILQ